MNKSRVCFNCRQNILPEYYDCSNCFSLNLSISNSQKKSDLTTMINCIQCTYLNPKNAIQCQMCQQIFQQNLVNEKQSQVQNLLTCHACRFQNHSSNKACLNCQQDLCKSKKGVYSSWTCGQPQKKLHRDQDYKQKIVSNKLIYQQQKLKSPHEKIQNAFQKQPQSSPFISSRFGIRSQFLKSNFLKPQKPDQSLQQDNQMSYCYYCQKQFDIIKNPLHDSNCIVKRQIAADLQDPKERLTPLQIQTLMHMNDIAVKYHKDLKLNLQRRIIKLGYRKQDLENLQFYIQNYAPIIIQIHVTKHMTFFINDTHYRNQFQTGKSSGSLSRGMRKEWQNSMFDNKYLKATDYQRVKYGVINFSNDPKGVARAAGYGPSYFLLKDHVRKRCTFTQKHIKPENSATMKYCLNLLERMNDKQLIGAFNAAKGLQVSSKVYKKYQQMQVHGPIQFSKDIQRIYVSEKQIKGDKKLLDMLNQFSKKNNVDYVFI